MPVDELLRRKTMKQIQGPCLCGADDCPKCHPGRPRCAGCGRIDCDDEDCVDKREAAAEARAEAYFSDRFERRLQRADDMDAEFGGGGRWDE